MTIAEFRRPVVARACGVASVVLLGITSVAAATAESGFQSLFDGRTLSGWKPRDPGYWSVEDGAITARITQQHPCGTNQYLVWQGGELADFELWLRSRVNGEGGINNGFQFRSRVLPDGDVAGYQVDNNLQTDWLVRLYDEFGRHTLAFRGKRAVIDERGAATLTDLAGAGGPAWFRLEDWHEYHLVCRGSTLTLEVDGRPAAQVEDHDPLRRDLKGVLALQLHSGPVTIVQFKDIRLKVLTPARAVQEGHAARARSSPARARLLRESLAHWDLGVGGHGDRHALQQNGDLEFDVRAEGRGALPNTAVADLRHAWFDAGTNLNVTGSQATVHLRARDPRGQWTYALLAKRGGHDRINVNLFSADLGGTPGPDIGFEVHTDAGFSLVSFPVSRIDAGAWHDFVGRYDGESLELLCDGRVMARRSWRGGALTRNAEPLLIGAETDAGKTVRPFTGQMEEAGLWARALTDPELAALMRVKSIQREPEPPPYASPVHFRPAVGRLADTIPFFWKGEYHIFYLRAVDKVPWEHLVSKDLVHWRELPTALVADGDPDGPDGQNMFTGSVVESDGTFHIFYTGWNPRNPAGLEFVMHATSPDLVHWTKHPEDRFGPDGQLYSDQRQRDFRDPYVFWNEAAQSWWMLLCTGNRTGVATSQNLRNWTLQPPLLAGYTGMGTPECPDSFRIGDRYYLICSPTATSSTWARSAAQLAGPYLDSPSPAIDTPILYAAKRMFDGRRHVLTGWIRDLNGEQDGGAFEWGGDQCVPREVYPGPGGQLFFRPVPEAVAVFKHRVIDRPSRPGPGGRATPGRNPRREGDLEVPAGTTRAFDVPPDYLLQCRLSLNPQANATVTLRDTGRPASGYRLTLRPGAEEAEISGATFRFARKCPIDASQPITLTAFVQGSIIECFVNDAYVFSCRAYHDRRGRLTLGAAGGALRVQELRVSTP